MQISCRWRNIAFFSKTNNRGSSVSIVNLWKAFEKQTEKKIGALKSVDLSNKKMN